MNKTVFQRILNGLKRALLWTGIALLVLSTTGLIYQTAATEADKHNFPAPGHLIDVGGFKMHISCVGAGSPTVILDALSGGYSSFWGWVQPELGQQTRVCAYDRAGFGWSESDPQPETPERTASNLHALLTNAGVAGPYVLVGHSKGGLYVRQYAALYPQEVVGLVLLDASHPYQFELHPDWLEGDRALLGQMPMIKTLIRLGVGHAYFALGGEIDFKDLPAQQHNEIVSMWSSVAYWQSTESSIRAVEGIYQRAQALGLLGDMPLLVITAGKDSPHGWEELQAELATLSTNSRHITIPGSTHSSLVFNPEHAHLVSQAILQVVDTVQQGQVLNS